MPPVGLWRRVASGETDVFSEPVARRQKAVVLRKRPFVDVPGLGQACELLNGFKRQRLPRRLLLSACGTDRSDENRSERDDCETTSEHCLYLGRFRVGVES